MRTCRPVGFDRLPRRLLCPVLTFLLLLALNACRHQKPEATIMFMDPEWSHDRSPRGLLSEENLREFEKETGIRVKHLPGPETSRQQLAQTQQMLQDEGSSVDVLGVDPIWSAFLSEYLLDLKPLLGSELASSNAEVVAGYTVNGRLVAAPYHTDVGILMYRTDLLKKYGYSAPPRTWDELEKMAFRIQQGERARGDKDFSGFVWPGAAAEGLTCLGLEWQMSEGGGRIIEPNGSISVNNEQAIRSWERAAHWVGWISPASVTFYQEWDAVNRFENSGEAAFRLGWTSDYFLTYQVPTPIYGKNGVTSVPGGSMPGVATLGGFGLGISRVSKHQTEAVTLVRFLLRKEAELETARSNAKLPLEVQVYRLPVILKAYSRSMPPGEPQGAEVVSRPSAIIGQNYQKVSLAYAGALHSVLTGQSTGRDAAARLETELEQITGLPKGPPESTGGPLMK